GLGNSAEEGAACGGCFQEQDITSESRSRRATRCRPTKRELLYRREEFAGGDGGAFFGRDGEDSTGAIGLQLVLHLHGFHHYDALAGDDRVAGGGEDSDYFAGHGAEDGLHGIAAGAGDLAGPAARVADFDFEAVGFDGGDEGGGRGFEDGVGEAAI